eukprot:SAG31_NODE_36269_length_315_cov_0.675926_1_plen_82_part_01
MARIAHARVAAVGAKYSPFSLYFYIFTFYIIVSPSDARKQRQVQQFNFFLRCTGAHGKGQGACKPSTPEPRAVPVLLPLLLL